MSPTLARRLVAEALGTGLLVATVVGSGIMAETLTKDTRARASGQHAADGRDSRSADYDPRADLRRAFQSGRLPRLCAQARSPAAGNGPLHSGANHRRRCGTFAAHLMFGLPMLETSLKAADRRRAMVCRMGGDVRPRRYHPRGPSFRAAVRALARRPLHHSRLLVYRLDVLRQSGRRDRPIPHQHLFRDQAR